MKLKQTKNKNKRAFLRVVVRILRKRSYSRQLRALGKYPGSITLLDLPILCFFYQRVRLNSTRDLSVRATSSTHFPPRIFTHAVRASIPPFLRFFLFFVLRPAFSHCSFRCNNEYITLRAREYGWNVSNKRETDTRVPFVGRPVGRSKCQLEKGDNAFFETKGNENCSSTKRDSVLLSGSLIRDATPHYL